MTATSELPLVVADKEPSLPKEIGKRLLELAKQAQLGTQSEIAKELGVSPKTVERLSSGESSLKFGRQFRAMLVEKGVKGAAKISLDPDAPVDAVANDAPFSAEEWERIGYLINKHMPDHKVWRAALAQLRKYAAACEVFEKQMNELGK